MYTESFPGGLKGTRLYIGYNKHGNGKAERVTNDLPKVIFDAKIFERPSRALKTVIMI